MVEKQQHSKLGIASTILAVVIWIYFVVLTLIVVNTDYFSIIFDRYLAGKQSGMVKEFGEFSTMILIMLTLFLVIPVSLHFIGIIMGLIGTLSKTKKRLFGVIGLLANLIPFLFLVGFSLIDMFNN